MHGVLRGVRPVSRAQSTRSVDLCLNTVSRSAQIVPLLNGTVSDELHARAHVALQVLAGCSCPWRPSNEPVGCHVSETTHLELGNDETVLVDGVNDFACVHVGVGLDECELRLLAPRKLLASCRVPVIRDLQLASVDSDDAADEERLHADL